MKKKISLTFIVTLLLTFVQAQINVRQDTVIAAPIPKIAYGTPFDYKKGYLVEEIKKGTGVYWITEGSHQVMFMTTGKGVIVMDAPPIFGDKISKAIAEVTKEPVKYLIYSHHHADHISGMHQFPKDIQVISSEGIKNQLKELHAMKRDVPFGTFVGGKPVTIPTKTFKDSLKLTIGNRVLKLYTINPAHTHSDVMVYLPKEKILAAMDLVWPGWIPFEALGTAEDAMGYVNAQSLLLTFDWELMVSAHLGRLATRKDVETNIEYLTDVKVAVIKSLQQNDYFSAAKKTGFENVFLTLETHFDMVAFTASKEVEKKWVGKLGGADVWTYTNCRKMMMWLRLN